MIITVDHALDISTGQSRMETAWKNKSVLWSTLVNKLKTTHRTAETHAEYMAAKPARQVEIKDIGGFVGGYIAGGRRKNGNIQHRQLVTLDIDHGSGSPDNIWDDFTMLFNCAALMYSTHKHTPEKPRLRLVIPLDREVFSDEYIALSRRIAGDVDINLFDDTTFQPERLMYWPSTSSDGEYYFRYQDGPWAEADQILAAYHNWRDASEWPVSIRQKDHIRAAAKKQGDPVEKPGNVGAFCRVYTITEAIEKYLSDIYEACDIEGRYTYREGSTSGGLVLYEDKFAFSHHGTDPCSGKLCNAFDLVRIHLYGLEDPDGRGDIPVNKLPSYVAMMDLCTKDAAVRALRVGEKLESGAKAFAAYLPAPELFTDSAPGVLPAAGASEPVTEEPAEIQSEPDTAWRELLAIDKKGNILSTIDNVVLIMENDPLIKGCIAWDDFEQRAITRKSLPWRRVRGHAERYLKDTDDANLAHYLEKLYGITGSKIEKALGVIYERHRLHPVREYLRKITWDGVERINSLLPDYLGVSNNEYVQHVTRKALTGAVARVMTPGCKFDYLLTLIGEQGDMKSTLFDRLGGLWFSDSFVTVQGKEAAEQLQGAWIIEIAELAALKRAEIETVKHFITKRVDRFRMAYGHRTENFPRQCVFFATTNKREFLRDVTGNRRFWPVICNKALATKDPRNLSPSEVGQIWAEAVSLFDKGELLYLPDEIEAMAGEIQGHHLEKDDRTDIVADYLDRLLPEQWEDWNVWDRRQWLNGDMADAPVGTRRRTRVTVLELWTEALGLQIKDMTRYNTAAIHDIMLSLKEWEKHYTKIKVAGQVSRGYHRKDNDLILISHVPRK